MRKFDKIAKKIGFIKPYKDVDLWYKDEHVYFLIGFPEPLLSDDRYDETTVGQTLERGVLTICPKDRFNYILPMLAADFLWHKNHKFTEAELYYSKLSMSENPKLTADAFSGYVREYL